MTYLKNVFLLVLLIFLTMGYCIFVYISSRGIFLFVQQMGASPGLLYDLTVKPYVVWMVFACASFFISTSPMMIALFKKEPVNDVPRAVFLHLVWISTCFLWHLTGLISPFVTTAQIIN